MDADKVSLMAETLWLADLAVTYMGSDPVRAWDRVTNLYDELNLPKLEAVPRTDAFFGILPKTNSFNRLISTKLFSLHIPAAVEPDIRVFSRRQSVYSAQQDNSNSSQDVPAVNLEIGMRRGEMLRSHGSGQLVRIFHWNGKGPERGLQGKVKIC